jgi:hypothetical protein
MGDGWLVSGTVDTLNGIEHAEGMGAEAHPRVGGRIHRAGEEI